MHAWAEIEHKLSYKSAEQVPEQFRRKLFRLSAKFEEADEQFEELRNGITEYRAIIKETIITPNDFKEQELNLDTLQAFADVVFPERSNEGRYMSALLEDLKAVKITMKNIVEAYNFAHEAIFTFESRMSNSNVNLSQTGALRAMLDIGINKFYNYRYKGRHERVPPSWIEPMKTTRATLGKDY